MAQAEFITQNLELRMRKKYILCLVFLVTFFLTSNNLAFAESTYVLPYPPPMPGNFLYKVRLISEEIQKYWYFGSFGQFSFSLKQSDKYLIQAKILFEYKQYLLGQDALKKSDIYFKNAIKYLSYTKEEGKNTDRQQKMLKDAGLKHIEVLEKTKREVPETFVWQPEKLSPTTLNLKKLIEESINVRKKFYE